MNTQRHATDNADSWEASVSAWVDGHEEIRAEELDTPYGRQLWDTYHLIGDVMRSESLAIEPSERFYARVSAALDAEPAVLAPISLPAERRAWRMGLSGLAIAAALATVIWMASPLMQGQPEAPALPELAQADDAVPAADSGLNDYLAAHQNMTGAGPIRQASFGGMGMP